MDCEQFQQRMTIPTWPAASGILQICQFLICSRLLWEDDSVMLKTIFHTFSERTTKVTTISTRLSLMYSTRPTWIQSWVRFIFLKFHLLSFVHLNEEDEDDAEPPEFHCSENCAKDVALHSFSLSSWYISQGSPAQLLFICSLLFLSILSCGFCWKLPERLRRDPRGCSEWSHLTKIIFEELSQISLIWIKLKAELIRVQLTDVFSRSSRIVPDPLQHKLRVAWNLFCSLINNLKWTKQSLPGRQWTRTKNSVL